MEAIARHIAETIEQSGNAKAVFGEPVQLKTQTVVPVATISASVGGGGGNTGIGGGGGGGFNLRVTPVGYLHEKDGVVIFTAIDLPEALLQTHPPTTSVPDSPRLVSRLARRLRF